MPLLKMDEMGNVREYGFDEGMGWSIGGALKSVVGAVTGAVGSVIPQPVKNVAMSVWNPVSGVFETVWGTAAEAAEAAAHQLREISMKTTAYVSGSKEQAAAQQATEEVIEMSYVDEFGNPCDQYGNLLDENGLAIIPGADVPLDSGNIRTGRTSAGVPSTNSLSSMYEHPISQYFKKG
jgi:hypothetical protein